jgi:MFS family permease
LTADDRWTLGVCVSRIFLFATFMTVASVIPVLIEEWQIGAAQAGAIVTSFTTAYAVSLFAFAWAADFFGAKRAVLVSAAASAVCSAAFGVLARDWVSAVVLYGLVGLSQGGIYTPLIILFAERAGPNRRGRAMGWLVASTSVGYAFSLLLSGLALNFGGWRSAFIVAGFAPTLGACLLAIFLSAVPNRGYRRGAVQLGQRMFGSRDSRLLTVGYTAHCWELLGGWAWLPSLIAAAYALAGAETLAASRASAWSAGLMHLLGASAAFTMGGLSDRHGRRMVLLYVAAASTVLSFLIGWAVWLPAGIVVALALVYSFLTIGDSPVLTTAITEATEPGQLGAVLAVRSLLGFGAGALSPLAAGLAFDAASAMGWPPGALWGLTFAVLGLGGIVATGSALALGRPAARSKRD